MKKLVLAAVAAFALVGCAHDLVRPEASRLVCKDEPAVPNEPVTDEKNKDYLIALRGSWEDCHGAVAWLRDYFDSQD